MFNFAQLSCNITINKTLEIKVSNLNERETKIAKHAPDTRCLTSRSSINKHLLVRLLFVHSNN